VQVMHLVGIGAGVGVALIGIAMYASPKH
jgi:hypothetical protein